MKFILLLVIFISVFLGACKKGQKNSSEESNWSLIRTDDLKLPLDSTTGFMTFCLQVFSHDSKDLLYINDFKRRVLLVYDLRTRSLIDQIFLMAEGPNSVGTNPWAFLVVNSDSLFVFSHMEGQLSLLRSSGEVVKKWMVTTDGWHGAPIPWASTDMPMRLGPNGKSLLISGVVRAPINGYSNSHAIIQLDLVRDTISYLFNYPKVYDKGFWVEDNLTRGYWDFSLNKERMIAGFGIDHEIRSLDGQSWLAKSRFLTDFSPVLNSYDISFDEGEAYKNVLISGSYAGLVTDYSQKVYYRFVNIPVQKIEFENGLRTYKNSVIVLNEVLEKKGEFELDEGLKPYMFFLFRGGLYMADEAAYKMNEDTLTFVRYEVKRGQ